MRGKIKNYKNIIMIQMKIKIKKIQKKLKILKSNKKSNKRKLTCQNMKINNKMDHKIIKTRNKKNKKL
jgi:hypothetical protein